MAYGVKVILSTSIITELGFCTHEQHISIAEKHNVVIHQLTVLRSILVYLVFLHPCTGSFHIGAAAEIKLHLQWVIAEYVSQTVFHWQAIVISHLSRPVVHLKATVLLWRAIAKHFDRLQRSTRAVLSSEPIGCSMTVVPGSEHILLFVVVEIPVHKDDPDILWRVLIANSEIITIVIGQSESIVL